MSGGYIEKDLSVEKETVVEGIEQVVGAFIGLFQGKNIGKMLVKLGRRQEHAMES